MKRLIFILLFIVANIASAQGISGTTLDTVNLRAEPSIGNNILNQLPIGTAVTIDGRNGNGAWLFISANGTSGWVSSRYVAWDDGTLLSIPVTGTTVESPDGNSAPAPNVVVAGDSLSITTKTRLNVRSEPSTSGAILGTLNYNQSVSAIGRTRDGTWVAVDDGSIRGWVSSAYIYSAGNLDSLTVRDVLSNDRVTTVEEGNTDVQAPVMRNNGQYVITGPADGNFSSYDMEITLHWNTTSNLNLRVTGPDGYTIVPGVPPSPTGGYFQQAIGANENCTTAEGAALEVITWDKGTAPSGLYHIEAEHVNSCFPEQEDNTLFWVSVKNDGPEVEFWVFFIEAGELFEFDFVRP